MPFAHTFGIPTDQTEQSKPDFVQVNIFFRRIESFRGSICGRQNHSMKLALRYVQVILAAIGMVLAASNSSALGDEISPSASPSANSAPVEAIEVARAPDWTIPPTKVINANHPERLPNQYIVVFKDDEDLAKDVPVPVARALDIAPDTLPTSTENIKIIGLEMAARYRSKSLIPDDEGADLRRIRHTYSRVFRGFSLSGVSGENITELARDPRVKYVEAVLKAHLATVPETIQTSGGIIFCGNTCTPQPCSGTKCAPWDLDRIDQKKGLDGAYHYYATGAGVTIWIVDTGIQFSHREFGGRAGTGVIYFVGCGMGQNCHAGDFFVNVENNAQRADICGHGTAVASVAAGAISGVAKGATLRGIDVGYFGCQPGTDVLIAGLDYVINNRAPGPNIINFSIEISVGDSRAPSFETAVAQAVNAGIVFVTSSGDEASNACNYDPGRLSYVITVAATAQNDVVSNYSNYGACVTLHAPGDHVTVADIGLDNLFDPCPTPAHSNTALCSASGTSMAAPSVAGIAALYLQNNPAANPATVKSVLKSAATVGVLSDPRPGAGSANLLASVWVPGNSNGTTTSPGGGVPPGGSSNLPQIMEAILDSLLFWHN
jgi:hypothetical protein